MVRREEEESEAQHAKRNMPPKITLQIRGEIGRNPVDSLEIIEKTDTTKRRGMPVMATALVPQRYSK
jgi:hypothetical protein